MRSVVPFTLILVLGGTAAAAAQQPFRGTPETRRSLHLAGRNVLGILQYCQAHGHIGPEAAAAQRALLRKTPPADMLGLDEAEEAGRQGIVAFLDSRVPVEDATRAEGILVGTRCRGMALSLGVP